MMKKIAIYTRKSVFKENSESIETQIKICKEYFKNDSECEFEIFEDEGFSGKNTNRPAFKRLMLECKMNKFNALICYRLDRISRNVADFSGTLELLQKYNVHFISIKEQFDTSTPMGRAMIYIASVFAQLERETIAERVKDNMLSLAQKGYFTGGTIPQGCESVKKGGKSFLQIVDHELINLYFNTYLEEGSLFLAYKKLKNYGVNISREGYRKVIRNPLYVKSHDIVNSYLISKGFDIIGSPDGVNGYMTYNKVLKEPIAIISTVKAIIEPNKWLKVQMTLDSRKEQFKNTSETNFLSGILKCPQCGGFYHSAQVNKVKYYACQNRINRSAYGINKDKEKCKNKKYIRAEKIESKVLEIIKFLSFKENFDKFFQVKSDSDEMEIKKLEKQLVKNETMINNLVEKTMILSNAAAKPFLDKIEELTSQNIELKNKIENEKLIAMQQEANINSLDFIYDKIKKFNELETSKEKNDSLKIIFGELEYDSYNDEINL